MHQEGDRVLLPIGERGGFHHVAVHGLAVPALEVELLERAERSRGEQRLIGAGEASSVALAVQ
jgi:hypothetical protein